MGAQQFAVSVERVLWPEPLLDIVNFRCFESPDVAFIDGSYSESSVWAMTFVWASVVNDILVLEVAIQKLSLYELPRP